MLKVKGFRALRYASDKVCDLDTVITPPYDVITDEERRALRACSPYNFSRMILPESEDGLSPYQTATRDLEAWIAEGVLCQDDADSFYLLEQEFTGPDGVSHTRRGFFGITKLPEAGEKIVLGHERTFAGPVEDRLKLTAAAEANFGPIFVLYSDPDCKLAPFLEQMNSRPADMEAHTFEGVTQRLWRVDYDTGVTDFFEDQKLYIADGHHRFQTAGHYRNQMREKEGPEGIQPYDYVLMGFVSFDDPGLKIYPPHRLLDMPEDFDAKCFVESLEKCFEVTPVESGLPDMLAAQEGCAFGLSIHGGGQYLLKLRDMDRVDMLGDDRGPAWRDLDVAILHRGIIENILGIPEKTHHAYYHDAEKALAAVASGEKGLVFLVNATKSEQVCACAEAAEPMPPKSTYFFPKLPSGMVTNRLK